MAMAWDITGKRSGRDRGLGPFVRSQEQVAECAASHDHVVPVMVDHLDPIAHSRNMSRIRSINTKAELIVRQAAADPQCSQLA